MDNLMLQQICIEKMIANKEYFSKILFKLPYDLQILVLPRLVKELEEAYRNENKKIKNENENLRYENKFLINDLKQSIPALEMICEFLNDLEDNINIYNRDDEYANIRRQYPKFKKKINQLKKIIQIINDYTEEDIILEI